MAKSRNAPSPPAGAPSPAPAEAGEALCFTAGYKGAPFSAGVIHAWLAADRPPPTVAAGISFGALSAAALQRCYQELARVPAAAPEREARRWSWFRRYLNAFSEAPLEGLWRAFPDPVDFFSDRPPVRDLACPPGMEQAEAESRRSYYLLVKLGRWLAGLPLSLREVAQGAVAYVRYKERYASVAPLRWLSVASSCARLAFLAISHLVLSPQWLSEEPYRPAPPQPGWRSPLRWARNQLRRITVRPLFGWDVWLTAVASLAGLGALGTGTAALGTRLALGWLAAEPAAAGGGGPSWLLAGFGLLAAGGFALAAVSLGRLYYLALHRPHAARSLGIERGLLHDYHLRRALQTLFAEDPDGAQEPILGNDPTHLLLVAAPLQNLAGSLDNPLSGQQVWAGAGTPLVTALRAALCIPGLLPPLHLEDPAEIRHWVSDKRTQGGLPDSLDLVDGSAVRRNPIPALFSYLRGDPRNRPLIERLRSSGEPRVHIVYNVPIAAVPEAEQLRRERMDIVDVTFLSLDLADRRDTKLEFLQTNFISRLEHEIRRLEPPVAAEDPVPIFADEIAPEREIRFADNLSPSRKEILETVAAGCRRSLETLYGERLGLLAAPGGSVPCHQLLGAIAPQRRPYLAPKAPGLSEVCRHCSRRLSPPAAADSSPEVFSPSFLVHGPAEPEQAARLVEEFPHLTGERPRIVFVASGGVFRGASHIGVLGALRSLDVWPDLIVGASVGSLMGGALGALSILPEDRARRLLAQLTETFLHVDQRVALTRELKNAMKQLGVRGRDVRLSPRQLRRMILRGSRSDPGYAATGAPPALIDAIAGLLLMPHRTTARIAAQFVAGHYSRAANLFWTQLKRETLRRLDVQHAVMGTSLLEKAAWTLLGGDAGLDLGTAQPFHAERRRASFFCTTTDLASGSALLLGRDFPQPCHSFDFREACLSSSAFPAVFSPRRAAQVFPGLGRTDILFADGGMFDNLPFVPAMEVLGKVQRVYRESTGGTLSPRDFLARRSKQPDLFIAAALDAAPETLRGERFESLQPIRRRAGQLKKNMKLEAFDRSSQLIGKQVERLVAASGPGTQFESPEFIDGIVNGGVLKVVPADREHINPTFAFAASVGLKARKVQKAIADGCFQTLRALVEAQDPSGPQGVLRRSMGVLTTAQPGEGRARIPAVRRRTEPKAPPRGICPYFEASGKPLECPFDAAAGYSGAPKEVAAVYHVCGRDPAHRQAG